MEKRRNIPTMQIEIKLMNKILAVDITVSP
jgi:hypothetical protein